jgi:hypothetical protein
MTTTNLKFKNIHTYIHKSVEGIVFSTWFFCFLELQLYLVHIGYESFVYVT